MWPTIRLMNTRATCGSNPWRITVGIWISTNTTSLRLNCILISVAWDTRGVGIFVTMARSVSLVLTMPEFSWCTLTVSPWGSVWRWSDVLVSRTCCWLFRVCCCPSWSHSSFACPRKGQTGTPWVTGEQWLCFTHTIHCTMRCLFWHRTSHFVWQVFCGRPNIHIHASFVCFCFCFFFLKICTKTLRRFKFCFTVSATEYIGQIICHFLIKCPLYWASKIRLDKARYD